MQTSTVAAEPARVTLLTSDLLDAVLAFLPRPRKTWQRQGEATKFLQTVANLCLAVPALSSRLGPQNQLFWRKSLFEWFDFSSDRYRRTNFQNYMTTESSRVDDHQDGHLAQTAPPPPEMYGTKLFLTEDLVCWNRLNVYYFASEYGFLSAIQSGDASLDSFPEDINAFGLFQDLSIIVDELRLFAVHIDTAEKEIWTVSPPIFPLFLRCHSHKITPRGTDLLQLTKLPPSWWRNNARLVSDAWSELSVEIHEEMALAEYDPTPPPSEMVNIEETEDNADDFFGAWGDEDAEKLGDMVNQHLIDWRHVRLVGFPEAPHFYIGKRARTGRWMGFVTTAIDEDDYEGENSSDESQ